MPGGKQKRFVSLCFPDVNVICECTFPWIERRHQIGINTEKPLQMLRGSSLQRLTNEKLIHKKNYGPAQKPSLPESTTLHFTRIWFLVESNENVDHTHKLSHKFWKKQCWLSLETTAGQGHRREKQQKYWSFDGFTVQDAEMSWHLSRTVSNGAPKIRLMSWMPEFVLEVFDLLPVRKTSASSALHVFAGLPEDELSLLHLADLVRDLCCPELAMTLYKKRWTLSWIQGVQTASNGHKFTYTFNKPVVCFHQEL